jgi:hypothetical protein
MELRDYWRIVGRYFDGYVERAFGDLTEEQWHAVPYGIGNSIAFIAWHYLRTEDNIVHWIIQERQPTVWMQGSYAERLGLPRVAQGTGMPVEEAQALRIGDLAVFMEYARRVRATTTAFLETWDPTDFDVPIVLKPLGTMTKLEAMGQQALPHGFAHLGEVAHIRALQGLPGTGI